jgi:hypothetical protein
LDLAEFTAVLTAAFTSISALVGIVAGVDDALIVGAKEVIDHVHGVVVPVAAVPASTPAPVASVAVPEAAEEALVFLLIGIAATAMMTADISVAAARHLIGDFIAIGDLHIDIWGRQGRSQEGGENE